MNTELLEFRRKFRWVADRVDGWRSLRGDLEPTGDCDDYATTVSLILSHNWFRFWVNVLFLRHVFWLVIASNGEKHITLWVRGLGWTCNIYPDWQSTCPHPRRIMPIIAPVVLLKLVTGKLFK